MSANQKFKIGDKVKHIISNDIGKVIGYPTQYSSDSYVSVVWGDSPNYWASGFIVSIEYLELVV
jgi:hypothetical protein